jgi:hypothetical protein
MEFCRFAAGVYLMGQTMWIVLRERLIAAYESWEAGCISLGRDDQIVRSMILSKDPMFAYESWKVGRTSQGPNNQIDFSR